MNIDYEKLERIYDFLAKYKIDKENFKNYLDYIKYCLVPKEIKSINFNYEDLFNWNIALAQELIEDKNRIKKLFEEVINSESYDSLKSKEENKLCRLKVNFYNFPVDQRFYRPNLLKDIHFEIDKLHKKDNYAKIALFIAMNSANLPYDRDRISVILKGPSSVGKDSVMDAVFNMFPSEDSLIITRGTTPAIEDECKKVKRIGISEINKNREGGANLQLIEFVKQISEGGISILKKDMSTKERKNILIQGPQKSLVYSTTEIPNDEESSTRLLTIPICGSPEKNEIVINDALNKAGNINHLVEFTNLEENWVAKSIRNLDKDLHVIIPYGDELTKKFKDEKGIEKTLFDYTKERSKRDAKKLISLIKSIAWLHQKQRIHDEKNGIRFIYAEPSDFYAAVKIFNKFFDITYSGLEPRLEKCLELIKTLKGKHNELIRGYEYPENHYNWVLRSKLQKEMGYSSSNSIKKILKELKDKELIVTYFDKCNRSQEVLLNIREGISEGISNPSMPIINLAYDTLLIPWLTSSNFYKDKNKDQIEEIDLSFLI